MAKTEKIKVNTLWPHGEENLFGFTRNDWDDFEDFKRRFFRGEDLDRSEIKRLLQLCEQPTTELHTILSVEPENRDKTRQELLDEIAELEGRIEEASSILG